MLLLLAFVLALVSLICWTIIVIDAFHDELWKGLIGIICTLYLAYYAVMEFDHPYKWLVVIGWLLSGFLSGLCLRAY